MSIGIIVNSRDDTMIEIVGTASRSSEWCYLWGTIHIDGLQEAAEGKLLASWPPKREVIEVRLVSAEEWDTLQEELSSAQEEIVYLREQLDATV